MHINDQNAVADYLVLGIWEAITLLGQARERCDTPDLSELLRKAETILISVVSEVPALTRSASRSIRDHGLEVPGEGALRVEAGQAPFGHGSPDRRRRNAQRAGARPRARWFSGFPRSCRSKGHKRTHVRHRCGRRCTPGCFRMPISSFGIDMIY